MHLTFHVSCFRRAQADMIRVDTVLLDVVLSESGSVRILGGSESLVGEKEKPE